MKSLRLAAGAARAVDVPEFRAFAMSMRMAVALTLLGGCASVDPPETARRPGICSVLGLATAGPGARDCGLVGGRMGPHDSGTDGLACALDEEARSRPFRVGRAISGTDYGACHFVVRDRQGQMWFLQYGLSANECAEGGTCGNVYVGRCPRLAIDDVLGFPELDGCEFDAAAHARERAVFESE